MTFPNVLYIGPVAYPSLTIEPIHKALMQVADVRTVYDRPLKLLTVKPFVRHLITPLNIHPKHFTVKPDLIFVAEVYRKIHGLEKFYCPKAYYIQDPHISLERYLNLAYLEDYDHIFITQKDYMANGKLSKMNLHWLPTAFDPDYINGQKMERDIPICFIGNASSDKERQHMISLLKWHHQLQNPIAYQHSMGQVLRRSKIAFNKSRNGDLNPRVFESMAAGAMLLTDKINNGLEELFTVGVDCITYDLTEDLLEKADYFLHQSEATRERICANGRNKVWQKHTYVHRAKEVLDVCLGIKEERKPAVERDEEFMFELSK